MTTILQAYTKILTNIAQSSTKEHLEVCDKMISNLQKFEERKDFKQWIHELNTAILNKSLEINGELPIYDVTDGVSVDEHPNNAQGH